MTLAFREGKEKRYGGQGCQRKYNLVLPVPSTPLCSKEKRRILLHGTGNLKAQWWCGICGDVNRNRATILADMNEMKI